jgi:hypothetical protein
MSVVTYYDTFSGWDKFQKHLEDPAFLKHLELYKWWNNVNFDIHKTPLMQSFHEFMILHMELNEKEEKEINLVIENALKYDKSHPYWWCSLHDCVESSSILMATLLSLADEKTFDEFYILNIEFPGRILDKHQVVCNKYIEPNTMINIEHGTNNNNNEYVIYDLIHPIYNKIDNSFNFTDIKYCNVTWCDTVSNNWKGMNYIQYFDQKTTQQNDEYVELLCQIANK